MKFSIIVPVYNVEQYLPQCIDSIMHQSYKDFELILVDDGSTDNSLAICNDYSQKNCNIKVYSKQNTGQADSRNFGLSKASGDYVLFVDSDDYLMTNFVLEAMVSKINFGVDVLIFKFCKFYESNCSLENCTYELIEPKCNNISARDILLHLVESDSYNNSPCTKLLRRSFLIENKISFEKGIVGEDIDWFYKIVESLNTLQLLDSVFYVYRQRAGSTTKKISYKNLADLHYIVNKWSRKMSCETIDPVLKQIIEGNLSKQYCNLLLMYASLSDQRKKDLYFNIKEHYYLLNGSHIRRVKITRFVYSILGFMGVLLMFKIALKLIRVK